MIIPKAAVPITGSVFNQCLSAAGSSGQHGRNGTAALSLFPLLVLGIPYSENLHPPGLAAFNQVATRKRVQHLHTQAGRLLNGDFTGALDAASARDAPAAETRRQAALRDALHLRTRTAASRHDTLTSTGLVSQRQKRKVDQLLRMGEYSRALAALLESAPADFSQATFDRIAALMPDREESLGELKDLPAALSCNEDTLVKVLRKLRRLVAAGPSGLTNDHILHMFPFSTEADIAGLEPLLAFVNKALAGDLCEAAVDFLTASTLVALYKPDGEGGFKQCVDGQLDVRPIAIPETLYRIVALCALESVKDVAVQHLLKSQQFGVSVPCGAEAIVNAVRLYLDQVDDDPAADPAETAEPLLRCLLKLDMSDMEAVVHRTSTSGILCSSAYCKRPRSSTPLHAAHASVQSRCRL